MSNRSTQSEPGFWRTRSGIVLLAFLATIGFLLLFEHRAHIPGDYWLLGGLLVACLLMHGLMHGGHGAGHRHDSKPDERGE